MFVYSLAGLKVDGEALQEQELPDNDVTARTGVYQVLARLVSHPDEDAYGAAIAGEWGGRLTDAGKLLGFPFAFGNAAIEPATSREDFEADYLRIFEVGAGSGPPASLFGGAYGADRMQRLEEVVRFYEYFGLTTSAEDPRPADHLATELEFMKYLTYKEAVSISPRLQTSYRRAQQDFLDRQLVGWLPKLADNVRAADAGPYWQWVADTVAGFAAADAGYVSGVLVG